MKNWVAAVLISMTSASAFAQIAEDFVGEWTVSSSLYTQGPSAGNEIQTPQTRMFIDISQDQLVQTSHYVGYVQTM